MSATLLDERQYRKLLDVTLPVAIRTEEEHQRLLEAAKSISSQLPLGEFHHLEILNDQSRTVIQPAQGHHLMIGTPAGASV